MIYSLGSDESERASGMNYMNWVFFLFFVLWIMCRLGVKRGGNDEFLRLRITNYFELQVEH